MGFLEDFFSECLMKEYYSESRLIGYFGGKTSEYDRQLVLQSITPVLVNLRYLILSSCSSITTKCLFLKMAYSKRY